MRMISVKNDFHDVRFVCSSRSTRSGFAHDATMFIDDCVAGGATCYYYNRTWERWTYESVCLSAVSAAMSEREAELKDDYKRAHGLSRVAGKAKADLADMIAKDLRMATLREIKDELNVMNGF